MSAFSSVNARRVASNNSTTNGQPLCQTCTRLNLYAILSHPKSSSVRYSQDTQMKIFSWKNATVWSRVCPLCALFRLASGNRNGDVRTPYSLRIVARSLLNAHDWNMAEPAHLIVRGNSLPDELNSDELRDRELGLLFLAVTKDHEQDECSTAELTADVRGYGMLSWWHGQNKAKNEGRGRLIDPRKADLDLAKTWLKYCEAHHKQCRLKSTRGNIAHFQVIDCNTNTIVPAPLKCQYVALSYAWGQITLPNNALVGNKLLVQNLPATVSDAMLATERLGHRYLWVDRYCIPDDPRIKHAQIRRMDIVYQNAVATLIAAGGDASHGLPGVSTRSRQQQSSVQLGDMTVFTTLPHPNTIIQKSFWMTRGWTYQEAILSRRRIFFTDEQLYFECNSMQCFEALPPALDDWHRADRSSFLGLVDRPIFTVPTSAVGLNALRLFTADYTRRNLSFDMDSLNGFLGVLAYFESLGPAFRHWWGLSFTTTFDAHSRPYKGDFLRMAKIRAPGDEAFREAKIPGRDRAETRVELTPRNPHVGESWYGEHAFLNALLWKHLKPKNRRRPEFPSWTWVGWAGTIPGLAFDSDYYGCPCHPDQPIARVVGAPMEDGTFKHWRELVPLFSALHTSVFQQPRSLVIEARTIPLKIVEVTGSRGEDYLLANGFYITKKLGSISLLDGSLENCTVYARLHVSDENDVRVQTEETDQLGYVGLVLGCGGSSGILVVRPVRGGGCERVGCVDLRSGSEYHGEVQELRLMPDGENSYLMRHWYDKEGYHAKTCSVYDIGSYIAVSPGNTTVDNWGFGKAVMQTVLR